MRYSRVKFFSIEEYEVTLNFNVNFIYARRYTIFFQLTNACPRRRETSRHGRNSRWLEHSLMRPSFSLRSFDTISMRGRSIRVLPCKMKIAFPGITGDVRRMKMPLLCCGHDNTVEGNWSLCLRSATPPSWFSMPLIRILSKFHRAKTLKNPVLFSNVEACLLMK